MASPKAPSIEVVPREAFNLRLSEAPRADLPDSIALAPEVPGTAHNWFAATLRHLPLDAAPTLRIAMQGRKTGKRAKVSKWRGLKPVYTFADPDRFETYVCWRRAANGRWRSSDVFASSGARDGGNGVTPDVDKLGAGWTRETAAEFLLDKGTGWSAWKDLDAVRADTAANEFIVSHRWTQREATLAMRVPFTPRFLETVVQRIEDSGIEGVEVDEIGRSAGGRALRVLRLDAPQNGASPKGAARVPTIFVTAREHATEHASSWAVYGLLLHLLDGTPEAAQLRAAANWLLVPLQDPDGAADSYFDRLTERFQRPHDPKTPNEVFAWTRYFRDRADEGRAIDLAVSIHNVESDDAPNLMVPFIDRNHSARIVALNTAVMAQAKAAGFEVSKPDSGSEGASPFRLYGWLARQFGALPLAYEVNDRWPKKRLALGDLQRLGAETGDALARWLWSDDGLALRRDVDSALKARAARRDTLRRERDVPAPGSERERYELLELGF